MRKFILLLIGISFLFLLNSCHCVSDFENSHHNIQYERAKELRDNYIERLKAEIAELQKNPEKGGVARDEYNPTEYVWISLQELEEYVCKLREVERLNNQEISGVAINFGTYKTNDVFNEKERNMSRDGDYRGRLTLFMAPTFFDENYNTSIENQKHRQFVITNTSKLNDYVGVYTPIVWDNESVNGDYPSAQKNNTPAEASSFMGKSTTTTSSNNTIGLFLDELTSMPPDKP